MADIEHDAARGAFFGQRIDEIVVEDVAARLAVEAVGDDVAQVEQLQDLVEGRRRLADMHHQRQSCDPRHLLGDLDRGDAQAQDDMARPHLDPADDVAIGFDAGERALDVDRADVDQLADPIAGDSPVEPMFRKAKMRSATGSMTNSRKPAKLASPAEPASTSVTTRARARTGAAGSKCRCRHARHGRAGRTSRAIRTRRCRQDARPQDLWAGPGLPLRSSRRHR